MKVSDQIKIKELLERGVTNIIEKDHLKKELGSGKKLRVKYGIDPTGPKVHLGHAVSFWKLRQFQELGHKVILIIGDYTAWIGDPSDKKSERKPLTREQVLKNEKSYLDQIGMVLDLQKTEIHHNSEWHEKESKRDLLEQAMNFTVNQMSQRDNFAKRLSEDKPIGLHEFLYPLLQGMDSVAVRADIEIGGNDQYFNLLAGRTLQKKYKQKPQDIMTLELLVGTDGRKMSKSYNNAVYLLDSPEEKYGKLMSMNDDVMWNFFVLASDFSQREIEKYKQEVKIGRNPKEIKGILAENIVARYHGSSEAKKAAEHFERTIVKKEVPEKITEIEITKEIQSLANLLVEIKLVSSKSEGKRLIEQGGVRVDGAVIGDREAIIEPVSGMIIQVGKRRFIKIK